MAIKVGDKLPEGILTELIEQETPGCTIGPNTFNLSELTKGKRVVIFGLPGAFTPTCSAKHVPGYIANHD
jgi:peroxiredoxin